MSAILLSEAGFPEGGSSSALCGLAVLSYNDQHRGDEVMCLDSDEPPSSRTGGTELGKKP